METKVAIIGIGRVGLPLGLVLADRGCQVFGIDINQDVVLKLQNGEMPFFEESGMELLTKNLGVNFFPSTDISVVKECEYVILTLGTPVDPNMNPDYSQLDKALELMFPVLHSGQTIILRSTVAPGTTDWVVGKLEDEFKFKVGQDVYLAFCPERIAEGKAIEELASIPQIIGGADPQSTEKASELFSLLGVECLSTDCVSAELAKLFTNMYRYINFAVANEFMILAQQWDKEINHVVHLVNHHYKRGGLALPGFSAGPCLFKDGFFLVNQLPFGELISTSWKINESIPLFLVAGLKKEINLRNSKVVILGAAFKADSDDSRQSLSYKVKNALLRERANVILHDPYIEGLNSDLALTLRGAEVVFVATNHTEYRRIGLVKLRELVGQDCWVSDIWNIFGTDEILFKLDGVLENIRKRTIVSA